MEPLDAIEAWPAATAAAAVVRSGAVVAAHGPTAAVLPLASVTKPVVALAVLVAVEEGTVSLDEPAGPPGSTVRHLLAHASGLPFGDGPPVAPPGRRRIYSNQGFDALGAHLAAAAGMPVADYVTEAVLRPLGMATATLAGSPASGASAAVDDLARLAAELLDPTVVTAATLAEATSVQLPGLAGVVPGLGHFDPNDWGLGFELKDGKARHWTPPAASPATFGHFGATGTFLWVDPDAGLALACLTDHEFGPWALEAWPALGTAVLDRFA